MMTPSPSRGCVPRSTLSLVLFAALLGCLTSGCRPAPKSDLRPGKAVVREIGGTEVHTHRLSLEEGDYLRIRIDQPGIDVTAKLVGPGGKEIGFFEEPQRFDEPDRLVWIAKTRGDYQLIIRPRAPRTSRGKYRLTLQELRAGTSRDSERLAAEGIYKQARQTLVLGTKSARQRSLELFQQALRRWQAAEDPIGQVDAMIQIADVQNALSNVNAALPYAQKALQIAQQTRNREGEARAFSALGDAYGRVGPVEMALENSNRALSLWQRLDDANWQGATLYSIGIDRINNGQVKDALAALADARKLLHGTGNFQLESQVLTQQGNLQKDNGEYHEALESGKGALKLDESIQDPSARAAALSLLGSVYRARGELEDALLYFRKAIELDISLGDKYAEAFALQALGSTYFNLGEPGEALKQYGAALQLSKSIGVTSLEARLLANTGYIHQTAQHDLATALENYQQARELSEKGQKKSDLSNLALTLQYAGTAEILRGNAKKGLSFLLDALRLHDQIGERAGGAATLLEIGTAYRVLGDAPRAAEYYQTTLKRSQASGNTSLQSECLYRWAVLDRSQGKLAEALRRIKDSIAIVESVRSQVVNDKWRTSFLASKRAYYELLVRLLAQLEKENPGKYMAEALEASERARARSLLDLLAQGNISAGIPPELQARDVELRSRFSWLQGQFEAAPSSGLEAQMSQVQDQMDQLAVEIKKSYGRYAEVRYPTPLRAQKIQDLLDERTVLLHYFVGDEVSYLFVVTRKGLALHEIPGSSELTSRVTQARQLIRVGGPRALPAYRRAAAELYSTLIGPATPVLQGKSRLLIAPDGPLYLLPFEALLTQDHGSSYTDLPYLLRRFAISYVPSASVLADLRKSRPVENSGKMFLAFADPDYRGGSNAVLRGRSNGQKLTQLPESGREVKRIAELFPPGESVLYLGAEATKKNVEQNPLLERAPLVHFALHGTVDEVRPESSGLELSDGRLRVSEIFNLKLNANLLTLSACETALGKEVHGEGMVGLTRAFLYAGAHSLVVSLWPVAEQSTPGFMHDLYRNLPADKAEALRRAKLAMISSREFSEPYYWAPFILSGDPR
jgi:CHAT domain-containing protein/tetratricopeptide (TPR) repeat protein